MLCDCNTRTRIVSLPVQPTNLNTKEEILKRIAAIVGITLGIVTSSLAACPQNNDNHATPKDLTVVGTSFRIVENKDERSIVTVGSLRNTSSVCIDNIRVEVRYYDAKDALIDTVTQQVYQVEVPPHEEVGFRVYADAAHLKEAYAKQSVRVVSVGATKKTNKPEERPLLMEILVAWGPMLLLIGVWIFFMRKINRKDSPQAQSLRLIEQQNALFDAQNKLLERLAVAAEQRPQPGDRA